MEPYGVIKTIELYFSGEPKEQPAEIRMPKDTSGGDALTIPRQGDKFIHNSRMYNVSLVAWNWSNKTVSIWLS